MKTTSKLTLNVGHHGWERKKHFRSILPKTASNSIFFTCLSGWKTSEFHPVPGDFYNKRSLLQNWKNSFENIHNQILRNSEYLQKRIVSVSMKTPQIKFISSRLMFKNLIKLTKMFLSWQRKINVNGCVSFQ